MPDALKTFRSVWRTFGRSIERSTEPDLVLGIDRPLISSLGERKVGRIRNWREVLADPKFGSASDGRLQIGLVPQPFMGDLANARVVVLLLNPGLGVGDFHAEFEHPDFRLALTENLRGKWRDARYPFLFLDPQWAWTGGYQWWHKRLRGVIGKVRAVLEKQHGSASLQEAQSYVAKHLAAIELIPYHSQASPGDIGALPSSQLAIEAARHLHAEGRAIVLARRSDQWGIPVRGKGVRLNRAPISVAFPVGHGRGRRSIGDFVVSELMSP